MVPVRTGSVEEPVATLDPELTSALLSEVSQCSAPLTAESYRMRNEKRKGEYSSATFDEFRTLKSEIIEDFSQGSILSEIGLIDIDELFRVLNGFSADGLEFDELIKAHRVEKWVRSYRNSSFVTQ